MKIIRILFPIVLLAIAGLISACSGGALATTSWPGLTVTEDAVYVASGGHVYAVDGTNGLELWRYPQEADRKVTFFAEPALDSPDQLIVGDYATLLHRLNSENGQEVISGNWPFDQAGNRYIAGALVTEVGIFAPNSDGSLYVLNTEGSPAWPPFETGEALWGRPAFDGSRIYVPSMDHNLYAIDAQTGNVIWSVPLGGALVSQPTLSEDGILYVGTLANRVVALDSESGEEIWEFPTSGWVWSGPALDGNLLYFGDLNGVLYILDRDQGTEVWKNEYEDGAIVGTPLVTEAAIYFGTDSGSLYSLDKDSQAMRWAQPIHIDGEIYGPLKSFGDLILVAPIGNDAIVMAYSQEGVLRWSFTPEG